MRITHNSIFNAVTAHLMKNQERFFELEETVASGKRVRKLSTDPPALSQILRFRTTAASLQQYQRNIDRANTWLELTETSLAQVTDVLMRAKELAVSQTSGTADATSRAAAAKEVDGLLQQAIQIGNARLGSQYLFAGRKTNVTPFLSSGTYQGDSGTIDIEIGQGALVTVNTLGDATFKGTGGGVDILSLLQTLKTALEANDRAGIEAQLTPLDSGVNQVVKARAEVGGKMDRLARERDRHGQASDLLTQALEETEGADLAKTLSELTQQEFIYQASLAASAKVIQPALLDFLG